MDINPYRFEASFHDFEFANFHLEHSSELIICIMAWLKSPGPGSDTVRYWATRMTPLITRSSNKPVCFVACNRTGTERGNVALPSPSWQQYVQILSGSL